MQSFTSDVRVVPLSEHSVGAQFNIWQEEGLAMHVGPIRRHGRGPERIERDSRRPSRIGAILEGTAPGLPGAWADYRGAAGNGALGFWKAAR